MTFPRPEHAPPDVKPDAPLRTFTYKTWGGRDMTVKAHYAQFMTEHVTFWIEQEGDWNLLVLAEANRDCNALKEVQ